MKDTITISWDIDDVLSLDDALTQESCRKVLKYAKDNHDASVGINWDVLQYWVDVVLEEVEFLKDYRHLYEGEVIKEDDIFIHNGEHFVVHETDVGDVYRTHNFKPHYRRLKQDVENVPSN